MIKTHMRTYTRFIICHVSLLHIPLEVLVAGGIKGEYCTFLPSINVIFSPNNISERDILHRRGDQDIIFLLLMLAL
jgi:hypothetical protein